MENDPGMNRIMNQDQQGNSLMYGQCYRQFDTWQGLRAHQGKVCMRKRRQCRQGLRVHQGKVCMRKRRQCGSTDRKTRSKSSQDEPQWSDKCFSQLSFYPIPERCRTANTGTRGKEAEDSVACCQREGKVQNTGRESPEETERSQKEFQQR